VLTSAASQARIYTQNPDFNDASASQNDTANGFGLFAQSFDDFNLGAAYTLTRVVWIGSYFNPAIEGVITAWTLQLWSDVGGAPAALLCQLNIAGTGSEMFLQNDNGGNPTYSYTLPIGYTTVANTTYWL